MANSVRNILSAVAVMLAGALLSLPAAAETPPVGAPHERTPVEAALIDVFDDAIVHEDGTVEWLGGRDLPPGVERLDGLPPGLARQVRRTGRLPPEIQQRVTAEIEARVPGAAVEIDGVELVVRDAESGREIESVLDAVELVRVMNRPH